MKAMEVYEALNNYSNTKLEIECINDRIETIITTIENISPVLSDMPKGGGANEYKLEDRLDKLTELQNKLIEKKSKLADTLLETEELLELDILDVVEKAVIYKHYILGIGYPEIADELQYCTRQIYRYRDSAITKLIEYNKEVI